MHVSGKERRDPEGADQDFVWRIDGIESAPSPDVDLRRRLSVPKLCEALCLLSVRRSLYNCSGKRVGRCVPELLSL